MSGRPVSNTATAKGTDMRTWHVRVLGGVLTLLVATVPAGCTASGSSGPSGGAQCAWGFVMDPGNNVIWPETNAIFWTTPIVLLPGMEVEVRGTYPEGRYTSVKTYQGSQIVDSLNDQQIAPDEGSANPFVEPEAPDDPARRRYTVSVRPGAPVEDGDNVLAGLSGGATSGLSFLNYRVYVSDDPADMAGGPLPEVWITMFDGRIEHRLPQCPQAEPHRPPSDEPVPSAGLDARASAAEGGSVTPITFTRNNATHLFPNPDDAYLVGVAHAEPGQVAVVRAKAPMFPDTRAGAHVTDPQEVRYWSMCVHMLRPPLPTADCAGDFETTIDAEGYYTYVVSMPGDRPVGADEAHGITWLPWGEPRVDVALTLRNLLPAEDFAHAVQNVVEPGAEQAVMGEYYPVGAMCPVEVFEAGGVEACLPPR